MQDLLWKFFNSFVELNWRFFFALVNSVGACLLFSNQHCHSCRSNDFKLVLVFSFLSLWEVLRVFDMELATDEIVLAFFKNKKIIEIWSLASLFIEFPVEQLRCCEYFVFCSWYESQLLILPDLIWWVQITYLLEQNLAAFLHTCAFSCNGSNWSDWQRSMSLGFLNIWS